MLSWISGDATPHFIIKLSRIKQGILSPKVLFPSFFFQPTVWSSSCPAQPSKVYPLAMTESYGPTTPHTQRPHSHNPVVRRGGWKAKVPASQVASLWSRGKGSFSHTSGFKHYFRLHEVQDRF